MRAHVMSDIHFEFLKPEENHFWFQALEHHQKLDPADILILAGDICQIGGGRERQWIKNVSRLCGNYKKVFYVRGNHEYFRSSFLEVDHFFRDNVDPSDLFSNLVCLDDGPYTYQGQRFVGSTMWYPQQAIRGRLLADFYYIGTTASPFEPEVYERHAKWLEQVRTLQKGDVVITHHGPTPDSIHPEFADSDVNCYFMFDVRPFLVPEHMPKLWIHGHMHHHFDYKYGTMRVYCNPSGYPGEGANPQFWNLIGVDIPDQIT